MNPDFQNMISDYISLVFERMDRFCIETGFVLPNSANEWVSSGPKKTVLSDGTIYSKHGYGCLITLKSGKIDFDFGDQGEIDGFDACRLSAFTESFPRRYSPKSEREMQPILEAALKSGVIEKRGRLYYRMKNGAEPVVTDNFVQCHSRGGAALCATARNV
jgi:hypothetical protein